MTQQTGGDNLSSRLIQRGSKIVKNISTSIRQHYENLIPATNFSVLDIQEEKFVLAMIEALYSRMIWSVLREVDAKERLKDNINRTMSDNYTLHGDNRFGVVHWVARAMARQQRIVLDKEQVEYIKGLDYIRVTCEVKGSGWNDDEYSSDRLVLDFSNYQLTTTLKLYYALLFLATEGAAKGVTISQALLLKINQLTELMAEERNIQMLEAQLKRLDESVRAGRLGYIDGGSSAEFVQFDVEPTNAAISFIYDAIGNSIGYPASWVSGKDSASSFGDTGEAERKQIRRANERYFLELVLPILENLYHQSFDLHVEIENADNMGEILQTLRDDVYLTYEAKIRTVANLFGYRNDDFLPESDSTNKETAAVNELLATMQADLDEANATQPATNGVTPNENQQ